MPAAHRRTLIAGIALALFAAGCSGDAEPPEGLLVAASPWPLAWLVEAIAPAAEVSGLGAAGQDPHELDLAPADQELLERADLVVHVGDVGFQPQVERAAARRAGPVVALADAARAFVLPVRHDQDGEDDGHDDDGGNGPEGEIDPHLWFDARTLAAAAPEIAEALSVRDPANAAAYQSRAAATAAALRGLQQQVAAMLRGCRVRTAVVSHAAFAYLLVPHGLTQLSVSNGTGHGDVSPARLAELAATVRDQGLSAVLAEPVEGRDAARTLAREAGVAVRDVDPLENPPAADQARGYPALLRRQARTFADVLGCTG
jgi:zinc transport system substrate-binding protein